MTEQDTDWIPGPIRLLPHYPAPGPDQRRELRTAKAELTAGARH